MNTSSRVNFNLNYPVFCSRDRLSSREEATRAEVTILEVGSLRDRDRVLRAPEGNLNEKLQLVLPRL